jgi:hypothetical protein
VILKINCGVYRLLSSRLVHKPESSPCELRRLAGLSPAGAVERFEVGSQISCLY